MQTTDYEQQITNLTDYDIIKEVTVPVYNYMAIVAAGEKKTFFEEILKFLDIADVNSTNFYIEYWHKKDFRPLLHFIKAAMWRHGKKSKDSLLVGSDSVMPERIRFAEDDKPTYYMGFRYIPWNNSLNMTRVFINVDCYIAKVITLMYREGLYE